MVSDMPYLAGVLRECGCLLLEGGRLPLDDFERLLQRQLHEEPQANLQEQPGRVGHAGLEVQHKPVNHANHGYLCVSMGEMCQICWEC